MDSGREDWRTFRLDRPETSNWLADGFAPRDIPGGDAATYFSASVASLVPAAEALVVVRAPYAGVAEALSLVDHTPVEDTADSCTLRLRATELDSLLIAVAKLAIRASVRVIEPDELAAQVDTIVANLSGRDR